MSNSNLLKSVSLKDLLIETFSYLDAIKTESLELLTINNKNMELQEVKIQILDLKDFIRR